MEGIDARVKCSTAVLAVPDAAGKKGPTRFHFIGIGGIGMSGIARLLMRYGYPVSGSDVKESPITRELSESGAVVSIGHEAVNVGDADVVVYSSAVKEDNPEMKEARNRHAVLMQRAQVLALLMENKRGITVAGSHGKTTTTSMASHLLMVAGMSPTAAIGGILRNVGSNTCVGSGCFFVAEADESDGSFLNYHPEYSIITNIDREHLDYYKTFENQVDAFRKFVLNTKPHGCLIVCGDDPVLLDAAASFGGRRVVFGLAGHADIAARSIELDGLQSSFDCCHRGQPIGRFVLPLGGAHNISNALGVIALGLELDIPVACISEALRTYQGARRRLEIKWTGKGVTIIDDYAHHPTEIRATLAALSHMKARRLVVVFQPHRYSRTQLLFDDFIRSFDGVGHLVVTDIYAASETPLQGVDAESLARAIAGRRPDAQVVYKPKKELLDYLTGFLSCGDVLVTMGAGDIVATGEEIARRMQ